VAGVRSGNFSATIGRGQTPADAEQNDYGEWVRRYDTLTDADREKIKSRIDGFQNKPLFSVLMPVYNPPIVFLDKAIQSVRNQLYPNWELCIADDASTNPACVRYWNAILKQTIESRSYFAQRMAIYPRLLIAPWNWRKVIRCHA